MEQPHEYDILNQAESFLINNTLISKENFLQLDFWFENDIMYSNILGKYLMNNF